MNYDYSELRGKIYARYRSQTRFARELGVSTGTLSLRLDSIQPFTVPEIEKSVELLQIPREQILDYFFKHKSN